MNEIVVVALKRPYTFVVLAIAILLYGIMSIFKSPTDVFPNIRIPVVAVVWSYAGLLPEDVSGRITFYFERQLTSTVEGIEHIESQSLQGIGVIKIYFQPGADIRTATAQVTSISQTVLRQMPPISIPAHTVWRSKGSKRIWVTRVGPRLTSENPLTPGVSHACQVAPESADRNKPPGRVPAIITCGASGSCEIDQMSPMGEGINCQACVDSFQRKSPMSDPA